MLRFTMITSLQDKVVSVLRWIDESSTPSVGKPWRNAPQFNDHRLQSCTNKMVCSNDYLSLRRKTRAAKSITILVTYALVLGAFLRIESHHAMISSSTLKLRGKSLCSLDEHHATLQSGEKLMFCIHTPKNLNPDLLLFIHVVSKLRAQAQWHELSLVRRAGHKLQVKFSCRSEPAKQIRILIFCFRVGSLTSLSAASIEFW